MKRLRFRYWLLAIWCCISITDHVNANTPPGQRPNVIIILTDDQGYGDMSCHGNPVLRTPAIDKLYSESVRFDNFHATPLCTPTRGQLMSGLDAMNNRATTVGRGFGLMRRDIPTMPEILQRDGYRTGIFGKWHLGDSYPDRPMDRGFQKANWIKGWGIFSETEYDNDYNQTRYLDSLEVKYSQKYCTDLWVDQAIGWMNEMTASDKPFFTYLALNAPHGPFHAPKEDEQFYRDKVGDAKTASFFGMIRNLDRNIGRLNEWLEKTKLRDNTIVIFMTDNGSAAGAGVFNAGMRGEKGSVYDGGHRVPCFIRWPNGNFGGARTEHVAAQVQDILPTLIDLLDINHEAGHPFDGVSLAPVLRQEKERVADRMFVVQYGGLEEMHQKYFASVVWNSWRLVGKDELYDVSKDPGQVNNVAGTHPQVFGKMKTFYESWWDSLADRIDEYVPLIVGGRENPTMLSSDLWTGESINTSWKVADAVGGVRGEPWRIHVAREGKYRMQLSRWPFHLERALLLAGPSETIGGRGIKPGKALPIDVGCVSIGNGPPITARADKGATTITIEMTLPEGDNLLQAWFRDIEGRDICGAYYLKVERVEETEGR